MADAAARRRLTDCRYYLTSTCSKTYCDYRHAPTSRSVPPPPVCTLWQSRKCTRDDCPYLHPGDTKVSGVNGKSLSGEKGGVTIDGNETYPTLCQFYSQGLCTKGDTCKFSHQGDDNGVMYMDQPIALSPARLAASAATSVADLSELISSRQQGTGAQSVAVSAGRSGDTGPTGVLQAISQSRQRSQSPPLAHSDSGDGRQKNASGGTGDFVIAPFNEIIAKKRRAIGTTSEPGLSSSTST